ncbi:hypothetical protein AZE42_13432, partial [Rhizopogon vesiculosus]
TTYGETFTQPPDNPTRRLSTASSNHGLKATTAKSESGTSNGSRLLLEQHLSAHLKRKKSDINKKSKLQKKKLEAEKKKPKMNGSSDELFVGDFITLRPAQYAMQKINNFEYVELWYFS